MNKNNCTLQYLVNIDKNTYEVKGSPEELDFFVENFLANIGIKYLYSLYKDDFENLETVKQNTKIYFTRKHEFVLNKNKLEISGSGRYKNEFYELEKFFFDTINKIGLTPNIPVKEKITNYSQSEPSYKNF